MRIVKSIVLFASIALLSACQLFSKNEQLIAPNTLETLQPAVISIDKEATLSLDINDVIDSYTKLLPMLNDPETQMKVLHRLADLKLHKGELLMAEQAVDELDIAVSAYTGLLDKYPLREDNDQVLYQLAKTYELKGLRDEHLDTLTRIVEGFPESTYYAEVQFRRGEILFTDEDYDEAEKAFSQVIKREKSKEGSAFLANAHYMHGWSLFKQANYRAGLVSYSQVLDLLLRTDSAEHELASGLVDTQYQTLVEDLIRVMSLSFSYLGGAESISALFAETGERHYEHVVYSSYANFLLSKEQYGDAVSVYRGYIEHHPFSLWSPKYQMQVIKVLAHAGFKRDIYAEKVRFVDTYGIRGDFWKKHDQEALLYTREQLEPLLKELADRHYVKAAQLKKASKKEGMLDEHRLAARYNREYIETFPDNVVVPDRLVLLAESETQLQRYIEAIFAFERAGYEFEAFSGKQDAAYASVLLHDDYIKSIQKPGKNASEEVSAGYINTMKVLAAQREASQLRFVDVHKQDKRAIPVLYRVTSDYFERKNFAGALPLAQRLIDWPSSFEGAPSADKKTLLESHLIKAHSLYEMDDYLLSEPAYQSALKLMPEKDKRRKATIESLAASVFKQAEAMLADGEMLLAVEEFLRVGVVAPSSSLRANAEYDAAGYLIELKEWQRAIDEISAFRKRYPKHELINTLPAKMALAYRETSQWESAAGELKTMRQLAKTDQEKQDIQFIVAELYDKADNKKEAILSYRLYANTYPEPADVYMEVTHRLAELYKETEQPLKNRFWLAKQMKKVDSLGDKADDRMRYLAAGAAAVLADDAFIQYKRIKLKLPLNETMIKKTKALEKAMKAYQKTASYGVSQYSTEAGYRMADIYAQLSRDLMDSDRPTGLNELELEQYEILLEEQAYPFEDSAIEIHEQNSSRSWVGIYDDWVKNSFSALKELLPGRYDKPELKSEIPHELY